MRAQEQPISVAPVRHVPPGFFAIVLVPVLIFSTHGVISDTMMPADLAVPPSVLVQGQPWLEAAGRYRFLAAAWFFGALAVLAVVMMLRSLLRRLTLSTLAVAVGVFALVLFLAAGPDGAPEVPGEGSRVFDRLGAGLYETALAQGTIKACVAGQTDWLWGDCGPAPVLVMFDGVMGLMDICAGLAVGALIVGMILCLARSADEDIEVEAAELGESLRNMRQQLYLSGLVLTFGMLFATSWMYWPYPMVAAEARPAFGAVLLSAGLYTGTFFSLVMLSFYLPVALILDARVKRLAARAGGKEPPAPDFDAMAWRAERGLTEGAGEYLRAGVALAAPILAAFSGGIAPLGP
jgi:hypothetical protein